jgi:hypothetical protein
MARDKRAKQKLFGLKTHLAKTCFQTISRRKKFLFIRSCNRLGVIHLEKFSRKKKYFSIFSKKFQVLTFKTVKKFSMGNRLKRAEKVFLRNEKKWAWPNFSEFFSRKFLVTIG